MKYLLIIPLIISITSQSFAQIEIDDAVAQLYKYEINSNKFSLPIIEELNVRTETRDWMLNRQQYNLRVSPYSLGERRASQRLHDHWAKELDLLKLSQIEEVVSRVHQDWIDIQMNYIEISHYENKIEYLNDIEIVLTKESSENVELLTQLLEVRNKIVRTNQNISEKQRNIESLSTQIKSLLAVNDEISIQAQNLDVYIDAARIVVINNEESINSYSDLFELEAIDRELELEKAEAAKVLDFVQMQYSGPHDDDLEERISLGVSLNIPYKSNQNLSIAKLKIEKEVELMKQEISKKESINKLSRIKEKINFKITQYDESSRVIADAHKRNDILIESLKKESTINPKIILQNEIAKVADQIELSKIKAQIIEYYLEYLSESKAYYSPLSFTAAM